ncbi:MAG: hypothetical protein GY870_00775 [archaeon]|nr:hypothetical protein [archaeon]
MIQRICYPIENSLHKEQYQIIKHPYSIFQKGWGFFAHISINKL